MVPPSPARHSSGIRPATCLRSCTLHRSDRRLSDRPVGCRQPHPLRPAQRQLVKCDRHADGSGTIRYGITPAYAAGFGSVTGYFIVRGNDRRDRLNFLKLYRRIGRGGPNFSSLGGADEFSRVDPRKRRKCCGTSAGGATARPGGATAPARRPLVRPADQRGVRCEPEDALERGSGTAAKSSPACRAHDEVVRPRSTDSRDALDFQPPPALRHPSEDPPRTRDRHRGRVRGWRAAGWRRSSGYRAAWWSRVDTVTTTVVGVGVRKVRGLRRRPYLVPAPAAGRPGRAGRGADYTHTAGRPAGSPRSRG